MKYFTFILLFALVSITSCSIDDLIDVPQTGAMRARIDGMNYTSAAASALYDSSPNGDFLRIDMLSNADLMLQNGDYLYLFFQFPANQPLQEKTYEFDNTTRIDDFTQPVAWLYYFDNDGAYDALSVAEGRNTHLNVTIFSIDARPGGRIRGQFSGRMYDDETDRFYEVEDGEFDMLIVE
jgi:hypothetical protein